MICLFLEKNQEALVGQEELFSLLPWQGCANLDFCAVECAERECVRARLRDGFRVSWLFFGLGSLVVSGWKGLA